MSVSPTCRWPYSPRSARRAILAGILILTGCAAPSVAAPTPTAPPSYTTVDATPASPDPLPTTLAATSAPAPAPVTTPQTSSAPLPEISVQTPTIPTEVPAPGAGSTSAATDFDPATLPDLPAPDPGVAGDENGPTCASDPNYRDEDPAGLDSNAITAWRAVEAAANAQGLVVCLNDGKRSSAQQQATYDEYVEQYGQAMADQYVLTPEKSAHVTGYAIDVQPAAAFNWLEKTNGKFGFCRTYDNEAWHFEFNPAFVSGCPARLPAPVR